MWLRIRFNDMKSRWQEKDSEAFLQRRCRVWPTNLISALGSGEVGLFVYLYIAGLTNLISASRQTGSLSPPHCRFQQTNAPTTTGSFFHKPMWRHLNYQLFFYTGSLGPLAVSLKSRDLKASGLLTSFFAPFGHSGCVTQAMTIENHQGLSILC